jgi:hypothetical protein
MGRDSDKIFRNINADEGIGKISSIIIKRVGRIYN